MTTPIFSPTLDAPTDVADRLVERGYAIVDATGTAQLANVRIADLDSLAASWNDLPPDPYLKDGGRYRRRRHASYVLTGDALVPAPHRAHWQPIEYNALHGGMQRWFEPVVSTVASSPAWSSLIRGLGDVCSTLRPVARWYVEAHQFRIDTAGGIGRPTPEGAHRDGVDFVAVLLVNRRGIKGGETRVFDAAGPDGLRFTMREPWTLLLLDDAKVIHETTPIQPVEDEEPGFRDTLVLTWRAGGFQGDPGGAA
jgi:hypothetical protein